MAHTTRRLFGNLSSSIVCFPGLSKLLPVYFVPFHQLEFKPTEACPEVAHQERHTDSGIAAKSEDSGTSIK